LIEIDFLMKKKKITFNFFQLTKKLNSVAIQAQFQTTNYDPNPISLKTSIL